ncbi:MAG: aspartate--tRNA(Asn) ligase [Candidatus Aenigmatarchaeota archaeon]
MMKKRHYSSELKKMIGKNVVVCGWCYDVRVMGGINFILLRDKNGIVQITAPKKTVSKKILEILNKLHQEDVLRVSGKVVKSKIAKYGVEIIPKKIEILSKAAKPLPLDPRGVTPANLDTRLDNRFLDLRTRESYSIFKIQSQIVKSFRDFLFKRGYIEIQPPIIISSASEGGAELFELPYFEKKAFLAQSPQLYKQICAIAFERVFCVTPVFRAEKFDQPTHLNEIRQMDVEQAFSDDKAAMKLLEECFLNILKEVGENCKEELEILKRKIEIPKLPLKRVSYTKAIEALNNRGEKIEWGEDFSKTQEKMLSNLFGNSFFLTEWPSEIKAFYAMPIEKNPRVCKAFDLIYNGIEISSGTQRIHSPDLLIKRIGEKGLNPEDFKFYIDSFRYGSVEHAGWSIGLERITMAITGKSNIREVCLFPRDRNRISP